MRSLSTAWIDALNSRQFVPRLFAKFDLDEGPYGAGPYGFWTDVGEVTIGGVTYRGTGKALSVSQTVGVADMSIPGLQLALSGIDTDVMDTFFEEAWHQKGVTVSIGLLSPATRNLIDTPDVYFDGVLDKATLTEKAGDKAVLTVNCEDSSVRMTRSFANVRGDADQRAGRDPTDAFMSGVAVAHQKEIAWGQPNPPGFGSAQSNYNGPQHGIMGGIWGSLINRVRG